MHLYAPTQHVRTTLTQEAKVIVGTDHDGPVGSYREVQILIPDGNSVYAMLDLPVQDAFESGGIGPNRNYNMPIMPTSTTIKFKMGPAQFLTAVSDTGLVFASVIVEHCQG